MTNTAALKTGKAPKAVTNLYESALADTMKNIKLYADREVKDMAKVAKLMK